MPTYPGMLTGLREWIARRYRVGLPAVAPWMRRGTRHFFVLGKPVPTSPVPVPNPTDEQIQDVLARWRAALLELFDEHAQEFLPPEVAKKGLKIFVRGAEGGGADSPPSSPRTVIRSKL